MAADKNTPNGAHRVSLKLNYQAPDVPRPIRPAPGGEEDDENDPNHGRKPPRERERLAAKEHLPGSVDMPSQMVFRNRKPGAKVPSRNDRTE